MLSYNTQLPDLEMPEYGRVVRQMIDHCLTVADRDERTRCANTIVKSMANLFPQQKNSPEFRRKLWDHLALMTHYELDVDYPCEITRLDVGATHPQRVPYGPSTPIRRQYGRTVQLMIDRAVAMEPGPEQERLSWLIAQQMKRSLMAANPDNVSDQRVLADFYEMSGGTIQLEGTLRNFNAEEIPSGDVKAKKKKRKKR